MASASNSSVNLTEKNVPDSPKRSQGAQQAEDAQDAEDLGTVFSREWDDDVEQRDEDEAAVHHVPTASQVRMTTQHQTLRYHLQQTTRCVHLLPTPAHSC